VAMVIPNERSVEAISADGITSFDLTRIPDV